MVTFSPARDVLIAAGVVTGAYAGYRWFHVHRAAAPVELPSPHEAPAGLDGSTEAVIELAEIDLAYADVGASFVPMPPS